MNKDILDKIDEINLKIEDSPEYHKYVSLKEKISHDQNLMKLINEIKVLQKDVVHHLDKKAILEKKVEELNSYPLYREYNNILFDINNTYAIMENSINNYFQDKIN